MPARHPLLKAAGATCDSPVDGLPGGRLHFYSSGEGAIEKAATSRVAAPSAVAKVTGVKIHAAVWLSAALLHEQGHATFSPSRLVGEVERRFGDIRPGVKTHVHAHCVANAPKNTTVEYSYLFRTDRGELRLYRKGDPLHPSRSGSRTAPDQADVPEEYRSMWSSHCEEPANSRLVPS